MVRPKSEEPHGEAGEQGFRVRANLPAPKGRARDHAANLCFRQTSIRSQGDPRQISLRAGGLNFRVALLPSLPPLCSARSRLATTATVGALVKPIRSTARCSYFYSHLRWNEPDSHQKYAIFLALISNRFISKEIHDSNQIRSTEPAGFRSIGIPICCGNETWNV